ncbi:Ca2-binding protein [Aureococcus anophagefferens]|nr:Ca2-binding protein [Aureococcus anophagefferens]
MRDEMSLLESSDGDTDSDHIDDDDYAKFEDELGGESSFAHADDASRASARHRHRRKRMGVRGLFAKLSGATRGAFARAGAGRSTKGGAKKSPSASPKFLARALSAGSSLSLKKGSQRSMLTGKAMKERKSSRKRAASRARTSPLRRALKRLFGGDARSRARDAAEDDGLPEPAAEAAGRHGRGSREKDDRFARRAAAPGRQRATSGDVLTIRCIAPPGTLAVFANWQHRFDQSPSGNALPRVSAEIEVLRADGLIKADVLGKSDPFAEVYAGGIQIGRTATKRKTLYPKWVDERFLLPKFKGKCLGAQDLLEAKCELRVVDEDIVGKNDFLGYACLDHADLLAQAGWRTLKLKDDPAGIVSRQSKKKKDEIAVAIDRGTLTVRVRLVAHVRITLVGVFDLAETDDARDAIPDPYARVLYRDAKWGDDTPPRTDALRPMWYHVVDVDVPVPDDEVWGDPLTVVVYDKKDRWGERDATIGAVTIPHEHLVYPHDCPGVRDIMGGPDGDEPVGKLTLHVEASCVPGRVEPRRNPDVEPVFVAVRDPRTGRPYWYDSCTLEPVWDDPRPAAEALAAEIAEHERKATAGARASLPLALLRAKRGFPEPPQSLAAAGACGQARVWWSWPRDMDGHTVLGFTVGASGATRRRGDWEDKGSVYVDPAAQAQADAAAAKAAWSNQTRVIEPLPEGWSRSRPPSPPYYNAKMRKTTWSRPEHDPYNLPTDVFLKFTTDELANIKHTFMEKDVDKSHAISLREFESCLPMIGEMLSPTDILWLFYQADLDPKAELDYTAFAKAVDTLKRARVERAPFARTAAAKAKEWWEYYNRPRVPKKNKKLIEKKKEEMALKVGAWEKVPHPQIPGSKYWRNPDTGEASYESPAEVRFFLPEALIREASEHLSDEEMGHLEEQFNAMDLDGSGAIDVGELKLLVKTLTGDVLSDGRARGLMHEVDMDRSGQMDYDEFTIERNEEVEALRQDAGLLKLGTRRQGKKRPHGHYCVCGCRAINSETQKFLKRKRKMRSIFPKLTAKQLKAQSQGGGASAAAALQHRDTIDESTTGKFGRVDYFDYDSDEAREEMQKLRDEFDGALKLMAEDPGGRRRGRVAYDARRGRAGAGPTALQARRADAEARLATLYRDCRLNRAAADLKRCAHDRVCEDCHAVLQVDEGNLKALYRGGRALVALKDHDGARSLFRRCLDVDDACDDAKRGLRDLDRLAAKDPARPSRRLRPQRGLAGGAFGAPAGHARAARTTGPEDQAKPKRAAAGARRRSAPAADVPILRALRRPPANHELT